jgi:hypothetical protein
MSRHASSRRFLGVDYGKWYVLSNLAVMLAVTGALLWLISLAHPLRWYWVLTVGFLLFWPVALCIERRPLGTYILMKLFQNGINTA